MDERSIFLAALDIESESKRSEFLDEACGNDRELRSRIEQLLNASSQEDSFLERSPPELDATVANSAPPEGGLDDMSALTSLALGMLAPSDNPNLLGRLDSYEVEQVIGAGGMGVVLRARDVKLNRPVAIKVLANELAAHAAGKKRFLREAQSAAAVIHPHVVTIHAVNEQHSPPYIVMEYIDGCTLQQLLEKSGPMGIKEILRIGAQTAAGLAAAHAQGVIHRDVKPGNILLENGVQRVKLTDFGLARARDNVQITQSGVVAGTPAYMSPEQARGETVDERSDLFSLGCVLYAMCTGHSPFRADSVAASIRRVCDEEPRPILQTNSEIPGWLIEIISRLLEKSPDRRFQRAGEVADLLNQHLAHIQRPGEVPQPKQIVAHPICRSQQQRLFWAAVCICILFVITSVGIRAFRPSSVASIPPNDPVAISPPEETGTLQLVMEMNVDLAYEVTIMGDGFQEKFKASGDHNLTLPTGEYVVEVRYAKSPNIHRRGTISIRNGETRYVHVPAISFYVAPLVTENSPKHEFWTRARVGGSVIQGATFSPVDNFSLLTEGPGTSTLRWDGSGNEWQETARWEGHDSPIFWHRFSPDGKSFATLHKDGAVILWDASTGGKLQTLPGEHIAMSSFSDEGNIAVADTKQVYVWDPATQKKLTNFDVAKAVAVALSPNGEWLATGHEDGSIQLRSLQSEGTVENLIAHNNGRVLAIRFSRDSNSLVSSGWDSSVRIWDVATGNRLHTLDSRGPVHTLAVSSDGMLASADGYAHAVRLWNLRTGRLLSEFHADWDSICGVAFSPDAKTLATASASSTIRLWDVEELLTSTEDGRDSLVNNCDEVKLENIYTTMNMTAHIAVSPSSDQLAISTGKGNFVVCDPKSLREFWGSRAHSGKDIEHMSFLPSQQLLLTIGGGWMNQWDTSTGKRKGAAIAEDRPIVDIAVAPDSKTLAMSHGNNTIVLRSLESGESRRLPPYDGDPVVRPVFHPTRPLLAATTGKSGRVIVWDTDDARVVDSFLHGFDERVVDLEFSPDGKLLASADVAGNVVLRTVHDWNVWKEHRTACHTGLVDIAFSKNSRILACGTAPYDRGATITLLDVGSMASLCEVQVPFDHVRQVAFVGDDRLAASFLIKKVRVWKLTGGLAELLQGGDEPEGEAE